VSDQVPLEPSTATLETYNHIDTPAACTSLHWNLYRWKHNSERRSVIIYWTIHVLTLFFPSCYCEELIWLSVSTSARSVEERIRSWLTKCNRAGASKPQNIASKSPGTLTYTGSPAGKSRFAFDTIYAEASAVTSNRFPPTAPCLDQMSAPKSTSSKAFLSIANRAENETRSPRSPLAPSRNLRLSPLIYACWRPHAEAVSPLRASPASRLSIDLHGESASRTTAS